MKKILIIFCFSLCACAQHQDQSADHIIALAKKFTEDSVFPKMDNRIKYEYLGAKLDTYRVADYINNYKYVYDHLSYSRYDSIENKRNLDSISKAHTRLDSVIDITVNVAYKSLYKRGGTRTDSIRLGYNKTKDKISYWPF